MLATSDQCGTCFHWHPMPRTAATLGQPVAGQCRGSPPQFIHNFTPQGVIAQPAYPIVPQDFPACGLHKIGVLVNGERDERDG